RISLKRSIAVIGRKIGTAKKEGSSTRRDFRPIEDFAIVAMAEAEHSGYSVRDQANDHGRSLKLGRDSPGLMVDAVETSKAKPFRPAVPFERPGQPRHLGLVSGPSG